MSSSTLDAAPASLTPRELADVARSVAARRDQWAPRVRFTTDHRYYARLLTATDYEVWVLTWLPGQGTEIHDHGNSRGAFAVVDGELTERSFASNRPSHPSPWALPTGSLRAFSRHHIHQVDNRGPIPAVSIHVYSPALVSMSYYQHGSGGMLELLRTDRVDDEGARR